METGLNGKVALVTGAGRGIGAAIARALAQEGCDLCLLDRERDGAIEALADEIRTLGREALPVQCDVRDLQQAARAVRRAAARAAGLRGPALLVAPPHLASRARGNGIRNSPLPSWGRGAGGEGGRGRWGEFLPNSYII